MPSDAEALLALDRAMRSRLVPIDAGLDSQALRRRYSDPRRYAIVEALIWPETPAPGSSPDAPRGRVSTLIVSQMHVPSELREKLARFLPGETRDDVVDRSGREETPSWPAPTPPRYRATVAFGLRNEPWLVDVQEISPPPG